MVQIVGFHPRLHEGAHEFGENVRIVVDAAQQHGLAHHGDAGIDEPGARGTRVGGQLARVVRVEGDVGRLAARG